MRAEASRFAKVDQRPNARRARGRNGGQDDDGLDAICDDGLQLAAQTKAAAVKNRPTNLANRPARHAAQGLYDPRNEHDACGVGFIAQMKGVKSHQIVKDGLFMLENLTHRGAVGADPLMGDGAGVLVQIPDRFFREEMAKQGIDLPPAGQYGVGHWFMPQDAALRAHIKEIIAEVGAVRRPAAASASATCRSTIPRCRRRRTSRRPSRSIARSSSAARPTSTDDEEYEARLYLLRKVISGRIYAENNNKDIGAYCVSLSARTIVYKGMFLAYQVGAYYKDLSGSALRDGADPRPPALLDQHLPVVEAGASLPHGRAQRRDQHGARQQQLDGGAPGVGRFRAVRQRHLQAVADLL